MDPDRHANGRLPRPGQAVEPTPLASRLHERVGIARARERGDGLLVGQFISSHDGDWLHQGAERVRIDAPDLGARDGDTIAARLEVRDGVAQACDVEILLRRRRERPASLQDISGHRGAVLNARHSMLCAIRDYFWTSGYVEVETPVRVLNPGLEPYLVPIAAGHTRAGAERWLRTSPELHLKKLLASGIERLFEIGPCFRAEEYGDRHVTEFTMLEWYEADVGLDELADTALAIVRAAGRAVGCDASEVTGEPERATYSELFRRHTGRWPAELTIEERELRFVAEVEPHLARDRPLLLGEFPPDAAALARVVPAAEDQGWPEVAARLELYIAGVEIANGYDELTDATEQRRRHERDRAVRVAAGRPAPALDEEFLQALAAGMPPAVGMALGVDRLLCTLVGLDSVAEARAFSEDDAP